MEFDKIFPKNLYHSYVIEGTPDEISYSLLEFLKMRGEVNSNSPDVMISIYDSFTITDGDAIKEWHNNKPIDGKKKICIIGTKFINREAEQSLLKVIEEPNNYTHFFIVIPNSSLLLDTILSRVHVVKNNVLNSRDISEAEEFIKSNTKERIDRVGEIIKEFKDEEGSGGLRHKAISLINGIESIIYKEWKSDISNEEKKFILNELNDYRKFLGTPGSSVKMILEHIALII